MTTQTIQQLLTEFATYLGEQDQAILAQSAPEALTTKLTEFKQSLDDISEQMTALNNADLKAAYQRGKNS